MNSPIIASLLYPIIMSCIMAVYSLHIRVIDTKIFEDIMIDTKRYICLRLNYIGDHVIKMQCYYNAMLPLINDH